MKAKKEVVIHYVPEDRYEDWTEIRYRKEERKREIRIARKQAMKERMAHLVEPTCII